MSGISGGFDASTVQPDQGGQKHPTGSFPFSISNTSIVPNKSQNGGMFVVEFTTPAGIIDKRYNLWFVEPHTDGQKQAIDIANKQLSALCHATGIFKLDWQNDGAALRGARGTLEIADQTDKATKQPNGYVEVKKVFDVNGNEPGKAPKAAPAGQPGGWGGQAQPQQQQAAQPAQNPAPPQSNGGWGNPPPQQQQQQPQQQPQGWQQQPQSGTAEKPPWAK